MNDPPGRRIVAALRENDLDGAARLCEELLACDADDPVVLHLQGVVCLRRGEPERAVAAIGRALALRPGMPDANANLGQALVALDRLDEAQAAFERAAALAPGLAPVERGMAGIREDLALKAEAVRLHQSGEQARAAQTYRSVLERRPRYPEVLNNLGVLELQRGDPVAAARLLGQAVESQPAMADAWANLGAALKRGGRFEAAIRAYQRALGIAPRLASAHYNLGHALVECQRLDEAVAAYANALECEPGHAGARLALIHQRRHLCDWRSFAEDERGLRDLIEQDCSDITPFHALVSFDDPALQARCARRHALQSMQGAVPLAPHATAPPGRIRIGYLSSDFRRHPVAWLVSEVIERHDRTRFEVTAYSHGPDDGSAERARLVAGFDRFVDIRTDNLDAAARRIHADHIDVLIDLNGHTLGARGGILARRPAPLQIAWLGYPGSVGADWIDYTIADDFVVPEGEQHGYTERLLRLPGCFQPSDTLRAPAAPVAARSPGLHSPSSGCCC